MKKLVYILTFVFLLMPFAVHAEEFNLYLFYGDGCPHCADLKSYLEEEYSDDKEVNVYKYEVWYDTENQKLWNKVQKVTGEEAHGVPYFIIGEEVFQGYSAGDTWEKKVDKAIKKAKKGGYTDNVGITLGLVDGKIEKKDKEEKSSEHKIEKQIQSQKDEETTLDIPLIGTIDLKNIALPIVAILMGLVDGFNPCAMWILLFLITMLFNYPSRKKMWILGCTFLFTSAFVYFLFMISFLEIEMFMEKIGIFRYFISTFALIFGSFSIYRYFKTKDIGCDVVNKDNRKKIMIRIKNLLNGKKFALTLLGIIGLAFIVNLIELSCSLVFPMLFTGLLTHNDIIGIKSILYIILYIFFFLLDDLIIFFIAMKTLKIKAISNKYTKYSHLIGGVIMIAIGVLLYFKII